MLTQSAVFVLWGVEGEKVVGANHDSSENVGTGPLRLASQSTSRLRARAPRGKTIINRFLTLSVSLRYPLHKGGSRAIRESPLRFVLQFCILHSAFCITRRALRLASGCRVACALFGILYFFACFWLFFWPFVIFHNSSVTFLCISQYFFEKLLKFVQKYCKI